MSCAAMPQPPRTAHARSVWASPLCGLSGLPCLGQVPEDVRKLDWQSQQRVIRRRAAQVRQPRPRGGVCAVMRARLGRRTLPTGTAATTTPTSTRLGVRDSSLLSTALWLPCTALLLASSCFARPSHPLTPVGARLLRS